MLMKISLIVFSLLIAQSCAHYYFYRELNLCAIDKECVPEYYCQNGPISTTRENLLDICHGGGSCPDDEVCCHIQKITDDPYIYPLLNKIPSVVAILRYDKLNSDFLKQFICGGSLISLKVALTSASCVINHRNQTLIVRAGHWDTLEKNQYFVERRVTTIISHEKYNKTTSFNNIALLILNEAFIWHPTVQAINIANFKNVEKYYYRCVAVGWGRHRDCQYRKLELIKLSLFSHRSRQMFIDESYLDSNGSLHESLMCARGIEDNDNCENDNGFPLICPTPFDSDNYTQVGIVTVNTGCNKDTLPGLYSNIINLHPWILEKLKPCNESLKL